MSEIKETPQPQESKADLDMPKIQSSMQGKDNKSSLEPINSAQKGSKFEKSASTEVFHDEARRLVVYPEDNLHLDQIDGGVGVTKNRRITDAYVDQDGAIWELKSGYEKGGIDQNQLYEYSLMERAGYINVRKGDEIEKVPVNSVNYLFETKEGAKANNNMLRGMATPWYRDETGNIQLFQEEPGR